MTNSCVLTRPARLCLIVALIVCFDGVSTLSAQGCPEELCSGRSNLEPPSRPPKRTPKLLNDGKIIHTRKIDVTSYQIDKDLETNTSDVVKSDYTAPVIVEQGSLTYPSEQALNYNFGLVEVELMVDKSGKVFEPVVTYSSNPAFESSALKSIKKTTFRPATYKGKAVEARTSIRTNFAMDELANAVSEEFHTWHTRAIDQLQSKQPKPKKLKRYLKKMADSDLMTPYALMRLSLIQLQYVMMFGSVDDKIRAAKDVLLFDDKLTADVQVITNDQSVYFKGSLFRWLVETQRYFDALWLYNDISSSHSLPAEEQQPFDQIAEKIQNILADGEAIIQTPFTFQKRGFMLENLIKDTFAVDGEISALNLRCERKFKQLQYVTDAEYQVPKSWGACKIEIVGKPNTAAVLLQY